METEKVQVDTSKLLRLLSGSVPVEDPEEEVVCSSPMNNAVY